MIKTGKLLLIVFCLHSGIIVAQKESALTARKIISFDNDWRFLKADTIGAEQNNFKDVSWRKLNVPHDWSIEGNYDRSNATDRGGGYLPSGIGWYRKSFQLTEEDSKKRISIEFDGVMANSDVWINGHHLGKRPYGYISFSYDLTPYINFKKDNTNIIAVRADNSIQPASRYYTGAGIYRHVRLVKTNPVHIALWGVFLSTIKAETTTATVKAQTTITNETKNNTDYILQTSLMDPSGKVVGLSETKEKIGAGKSIDISQIIEVKDPQLWNLDQPVLYKAVTKILSGKLIVDDVINAFGIRDIKFEGATGFWLNGKNIKIKGVCMHHDGGAVGAAVPLGVWQQRFSLLKQAGVNAIRTSHNPVAPEVLDLCDKMGLLIMDETFDTWTAAKNHGEKGYNLYFKDWWQKDTRDMVLRDRNHPSIVIYSIGNEIHDDLSYPEGYKMYKAQQDVVHQFDSTRPVTMALFRPNVSKVYTNGFAEHMEVVGQNYRENEMIAVHEAHPDWKVIGTENTHVLSMWLALRDKPYIAGQFLWTGFDYLGEADWPETTNNQGLFDRTGNWKQQGLQRQSWWADEPVVHIVRKSDNAGAGVWVANWTPVDFDTYDNAKVNVYSNCESVELFLNGRSLGSKLKPADDSPREWDVTFEKGTIKAIGKNAGKEVSSEAFTSAGIPDRIILTGNLPAIGSTWDDVAFVTATLVDANGIVCPNADNLISFSIDGPGVVAATDNGNIISHEQYQVSEHHAFRGKSIAIIKAVKSTGVITVTAKGDNIKAGSIKINIK
jgi:beta-galactosidase